MATRFDSGNVAGLRAKENRFEGRNVQEFSLAIGKGTLQQLVQLCSKPRTTEELGQLTSRPGILTLGFAHLSLSCLIPFPAAIDREW